MTYRIRDVNIVHNNILNNSVSKQVYSIPKAQRFKNNKTQASYKYYDLPSTNNCKANTFSSSERKTLATGDKNIPPPNKYFENKQKNLLNDVNPISFAKGRSECKNLNFIKIYDNPGPGAYNPNPQFVDPHSGIKYSIRTKTQYNEKLIKPLAPGPGNYQLKNTWIGKDKILSTDKNYGSPLIRDSKNQRGHIEQSKSQLPLYILNRTVKGDQTFNKTGGFSIGKSLRFSNRIKTQNPGPGSYQRFSQF